MVVTSEFVSPSQTSERSLSTDNFILKPGDGLVSQV